MVRLHMTGSTHPRQGWHTAPSHSVKSKKQTPPNSQTPTDALPGSVSSAARKEEGGCPRQQAGVGQPTFSVLFPDGSAEEGLLSD